VIVGARSGLAPPAALQRLKLPPQPVHLSLQRGDAGGIA